MSTSDISSSRPPSRAGLCGTCVHQQLVRNTRGSTFSLCRRSRADPAYPRYPRIPVLACPGHEPRAAAGDGG
jgi:hypothetical protein